MNFARYAESMAWKLMSAMYGIETSLPCGEFVSPRWGFALGFALDPGRRYFLACPGLACWWAFGPLRRGFPPKQTRLHALCGPQPIKNSENRADPGIFILSKPNIRGRGGSTFCISTRATLNRSVSESYFQRRRSGLFNPACSTPLSIDAPPTSPPPIHAKPYCLGSWISRF